jgi:hypothetical protein
MIKANYAFFLPAAFFFIAFFFAAFGASARTGFI